jgi:HEAT repeat protein
VWAIADGMASLSLLPLAEVRPLLELFARLAADPAGGMRQEAAIYAQGVLGRAEALPVVLKALLDPATPAKALQRAARAVGECAAEDGYPAGEAEARRALSQVVTSFAGERPWPPAARREAAGSLGYIGDESSLEALLAAISGDPEAEVRQRAVAALVQVAGQEEAAERLVAALPERLGPDELVVVQRLLQALVDIGGEAGFAGLQKANKDWVLKGLQQAIGREGIAQILLEMLPMPVYRDSLPVMQRLLEAVAKSFT